MDPHPDPVRAALRDLRQLLIGHDRPSAAPAASRRWRHWRTAVMQAGLLAVIGLTFAAAQYLQDNRGMSELWAFVLALGGTVPAAVAVRYPLWGWRIGYPFLYLGVMDATAREPWPWNPVQIIFFLLVLAGLAARVPAGVAAWAGLLSLLPVYLYVENLANAHGVTVLVAVTLMLGALVRRNRLSRRALDEQTEISELEKARRAVLEERTRIAREMHDVVAHHMSLIAVQAETAPYRLGELPEPARAEFTAIAGSAREAMTDMRRLLGVLRSEATEPRTAPQPGLADLPEMIDAARRAGMTVRLSGGGDHAPEAVGLAAYRIVQEALANAARHAPGAAVRVALAEVGGGLTVRVDNDPGPTPAATNHGPGHGLTGMRERARLLGGTFSAGPADGGGYAVVAHLPYDADNGER